MSYRTGFIVLLTIVITFVVLGIVGMNMEDTPQPAVSTPRIQTDVEAAPQSDAWAKDIFMDACNTGSMYNYCDCVWEQMRAVYSVEEISDMGINETYSQYFYDTVDFCVETEL